MELKVYFLNNHLVLVKAVLSAIPLFLMVVFRAPIGVVGAIEKILRSFLWGSDDNSRKHVWIPRLLL